LPGNFLNISGRSLVTNCAFALGGSGRFCIRRERENNFHILIFIDYWVVLEDLTLNFISGEMLGRSLDRNVKGQLVFRGLTPDRMRCGLGRRRDLDIDNLLLSDLSFNFKFKDNRLKIKLSKLNNFIFLLIFKIGLSFYIVLIFLHHDVLREHLAQRVDIRLNVAVNLVSSLVIAILEFFVLIIFFLLFLLVLKKVMLLYLLGLRNAYFGLY
jgi:hypothetical protein